jgi:hypothetical protein
MLSSLFLTTLLVAGPPDQAGPAKNRFGDAVVTILKGATRVESARIQLKIVTITPVAPHFGGYPVLKMGKEEGQASAEALACVLLAEGRLPVTQRRVNFFDPRVGFCLWKEKERVEVLFDPFSGNVQVTGYDANDKVLEQTTEVAHPATFNALLQRAQVAFPDDVDLRQIKKVTEANRLEIFRTDPIMSVTPVAPQFGDYAVKAIGKEQGESSATALRNVLLEEAQRTPARRVNDFAPWIGFRLWQDKERIEVLFDPQTRNTQVISYDANGKVLTQTLEVAHAATFNALLERARIAFPDDVALRPIKELPVK